MLTPVWPVPSMLLRTPNVFILWHELIVLWISFFLTLLFLIHENSGYMAPEYVMHGHLTVKADVFSFGVVVLELISGQRNSSFNLNVDAQNLLDWVR
jgi:hypothetical protein